MVVIAEGSKLPAICLALNGNDLELRQRFTDAPGLLIGISGKKSV